MRATMFGLQDQFLLNNLSLVDARQVATHELGVKRILGAPAFRALWVATRRSYAPEFAAYVDALIAGAPLDPPLDLSAQIRSTVAQLKAAGGAALGGAGRSMTLSDLASIGSLVSAAAVLVSLIYLGLQVSQTARNQRAAMVNGTSARTSDQLLRVIQLHNADLWARLITSDETYTTTEIVKLMNILTALVVGIEELVPASPSEPHRQVDVRDQSAADGHPVRPAGSKGDVAVHP